MRQKSDIGGQESEGGTGSVPSGEHTRPRVFYSAPSPDSRDQGTAVEAGVSAAEFKRSQATRLPLQPRDIGGFTLAELLVSVGVLVLLVLLATQLLNSAATITTLGHKRMDADSQARQLLDRMAIDFAQMVKRSDVDYYLKSSATAPLRNVPQLGNDRIAFYSTVPGYYPAIGSQSPVSLVSYRVNSQNKLERMGKGLVWNAVSTETPVVFIPIPLASPLPTPEMPSPTPNPLPTPAWPTVIDFAASPTPEPSAEVIGPQVFRFEYYYLLKGWIDPTTIPPTAYGSILSATPWDDRIPGHTGVSGMQDVSAILVDIAVIDPKSRVLLTDSQVTTLAGNTILTDYAGEPPGQLRANWQTALNANTSLPRPAVSGIRLYERYFYLSPPTLLTPSTPSPAPSPTATP